MNGIAAMSEQLLSGRIRQKLNEVNVAAQTQLSRIQDHVNFTLQQANFKCAHECFDRRRSQQDISNCVENCSVPVVRAQQGVENEMAEFQEKHKEEALVVVVWCFFGFVNSVQIRLSSSKLLLMKIAERLKASFGINH